MELGRFLETKSERIIDENTSTHFTEVTTSQSHKKAYRSRPRLPSIRRRRPPKLVSFRPSLPGHIYQYDPHKKLFKSSIPILQSPTRTATDGQLRKKWT
jgi:hypothetical protein